MPRRFALLAGSGGGEPGSLGVIALPWTCLLSCPHFVTPPYFSLQNSSSRHPQELRETFRKVSPSHSASLSERMGSQRSEEELGRLNSRPIITGFNYHLNSSHSFIHSLPFIPFISFLFLIHLSG